MIRHVISMICKDIIVDQTTNLVSYINCLEELTTVKLPIKVNFQVGTLWEKDTNDKEVLKMKIILEAPSKKRDKVFESKDMEMHKKRHRVNIFVNGINVEEEGIYTIIIEHLTNDRWQTDNKINLEVKHKQQ